MRLQTLISLVISCYIILPSGLRFNHIGTQLFEIFQLVVNQCLGLKGNSTQGIKNFSRREEPGIGKASLVQSLPQCLSSLAMMKQTLSAKCLDAKSPSSCSIQNAHFGYKINVHLCCTWFVVTKVMAKQLFALLNRNVFKL